MSSQTAGLLQTLSLSDGRSEILRLLVKQGLTIIIFRKCMDCSVFQSEEWEIFKKRTGYSKSYRIGNILLLQRKILHKWSMLYAPMVSESQLKTVQSKIFNEELSKLAKSNGIIFFRLELNINPDSKVSLPKEYIQSFEEMQPRHNWLIDLSKTEDELLTEMKQKGRYNLKIAQKNGLEFTSESVPGRLLDIFYDQYKKTGERHSVSYRNKRYFEELLEIFGQKDYARVCMIEKDNTPLASAMVLFYGKSALYLYGGSNEEMRQLMAPYLLHWEIVKEAKRRNLSEYNFLGIAPNEDKNHPWAGITRFKKQFGGYREDIIGCYDLVFQRGLYWMFKIAERLRR